ncbi:hypothetical protein IJD15_04345 [bacterium]|nr:hypothetical protein [bacterium]
MKTKILLVNTIAICLFIFFINWYIEKDPQGKINSSILNRYTKNFDIKNIDIAEYPTEDSLVKRVELTKENMEKFCGKTKIEYGETKEEKNPIVVLGCSYAYGQGLKDEETFSYLLSEYTNRPVISFAHCGSQGVENLIIAKNYEKQDRLKSADYFIYVYMHDHINRFFSFDNISTNYNSFFKTTNIENLLLKIPVTKYILVDIRTRKILKGFPYTDKSNEFLKKNILLANEKIKEYNPNAKFIVILYNEKMINDYNPCYIKFNLDKYNDNIWDDLRKYNITIVKTEDIMGFPFDKDYKLEEDITDWHPNARAWKEFTPKFASKYIKDIQREIK